MTIWEDATGRQRFQPVDRNGAELYNRTPYPRLHYEVWLPPEVYPEPLDSPAVGSKRWAARKERSRHRALDRQLHRAPK